MNEKRAQILATALKLFVTNGFHATPTSKIAKEAGVATGTLFHHFKTKEELINTLYLETKGEMTQSLSTKVEEQETIKGKLRQIFFNAIHWAVNHTNHQLFYSQFSNSAFISNLTRKLGHQRFQFIYDILKQGQEKEILKPISIDLMFEAIDGTLNGITKYLIEHPEKITDEQCLESAFALYWDTLKG
ncbi:TetR/AcrR family transcriptional regulator [Sunxiuqinia sp. sy24]|uniref:TetR/AcrR family transcriptional regulator n=1 Tax=Sunxiuqinia sp. sy24 TaxID=3461495 RepID=UPI0040466D22